MSDTFSSLHARKADSILTVADIASLPAAAQEGDARWVMDVNRLYIYNGSTWANDTGSVGGPGSSTDNAIARWDGATGGILQDSAVTISDTGIVAGASISGAANTITNVPIATGVSGLGANVATFLGTPSSANLAAALTDETGSGAAVFATSPVLITPALGTPSAAVLTNATGLPIASGISGLGAGMATFLATPTSANLAATLTDETGSGANVFGTAPTIAGGSITALTAFSLRDTSAAFNVPIVATSSTPLNANRTVTLDVRDSGRTIALGGNLSLGNNFTTGAHDTTFTTSASTSLTLPTSGTLTTTTNDLSVFAATTSLQLKTVISDETGSGALVFATSPTLVTPLLGTPTSGTLTNCTGLPIGSGVSGLAANIATFLATPSSANLIAAVTDETGSGALVFGTGPTLSSPVISTISNTGTITIPTTTTTLAGLAIAQTFTANQTIQRDIASGASNALNLTSNASAAGPDLRLMVNAGRGTAASPAAVQTADTLFSLIMRGNYDTTANNYAVGASILGKVQATWSSTTDHSGRLEFYTAAAGDTNETLRMTIGSTGGVTIAGLTTDGVVKVASGLLSSEATLDRTRGGTGVSSTATFPTTATNDADFVMKGNVAQTITGAKTFSAITTMSAAGLTAPTTALGNVYSGGTYTPTNVSGNNTNITTLTIGSNSAYWMRVGDIVHVAGYLSAVDPAAALTASLFNLSLPVAATGTAVDSLAGTAVGYGNPSTQAVVRGNGGTNDYAEFFFFSTADASSNVWSYTFTYRVI